jgi:hypothetical protein
MYMTEQPTFRASVDPLRFSFEVIGTALFLAALAAWIA